MGEAEQNGRPVEKSAGLREIAFEAYGVRVAVGVRRPELLDRIRPILPPGWRPIPSESADSRFMLEAMTNGNFIVTLDDEELGGIQSIDLDLALEMLEAQLRVFLGTWATDTTFVHAGVVAHEGRAIVIPAASFAGKTTLVAALVKNGATYYSDEFAVINADGHVIPYPKPLSLRDDGGWEQTDHAIESLGGAAGEGPIPVGMVVVTVYEPGAKWEPKRLSAGAGAMIMVKNAIPAQERPQQVMAAVSRASRDALVLEGERGEADELAPVLLAELERHAG